MLYDFGTKGSGTTPYSRGLDGRLPMHAFNPPELITSPPSHLFLFFLFWFFLVRLTLKGGVRELIAAESLHYMGVNTSR